MKNTGENKMKKMLTEWREFLKEQDEEQDDAAIRARHEKVYQAQASGKRSGMHDNIHFPNGSIIPKGGGMGSRIESNWDHLERLADILGIGPKNRILQLGKSLAARYKAFATRPEVREKIADGIKWYKESSPEEKKKFDDWANTRNRW